MSLTHRNLERIQKIREENGLSRQEVLHLLLNLYELEDLSPLMKQIKTRYQQGIEPKLLTQLSVLFSQLASIFKYG